MNTVTNSNMRLRLMFAGATILALLIGLGGGAWYELRTRPPAFCEISGRPIHPDMATVVQVDGKKLYTCCPRCPLTLAVQTGKSVRIIEVTDYVTGRRLKASDAYFVDGSQVEMCSSPRLKSDESRTPYQRLFDRCSPSLLTFAGEEDARRFVNQYGGSIKRLDDLEREAAAARSSTGEKQHD